jgi:8-oxo-dGTP diphosphatase
LAAGVEAAAPRPAVDVVKSPGVVRAAGGIVLRDSPNGAREVLLVHRPKYDDWSLPKGKADPCETDSETALREVEEETGIRCALGPEVGGTRYRDAEGRPKVVRYWLMWPVVAAPEFVPNREVDEVRWYEVDDARRILSYAHDRELLGTISSEVAE